MISTLLSGQSWNWAPKSKSGPLTMWPCRPIYIPLIKDLVYEGIILSEMKPEENLKLFWLISSHIFSFFGKLQSFSMPS